MKQGSILPVRTDPMPDMNQRHRITIQVDGNAVEGNYWVAGKILVVSTAKGGTSTSLNHRQPEQVAMTLLRKLAAEGKA